MGEICFQLTACLFGPLAFGQIEDKCDRLVAACREEGAANEHGNPAAVFAKILLLEGPNGPG